MARQAHKSVRVYIGNRQASGQLCGWGEGRCVAEAIKDALQKAGASATYDRQTNMVWFDGGCSF